VKVGDRMLMALLALLIAIGVGCHAGPLGASNAGAASDAVALHRREYVAVVDRVIDGDTIAARIYLGLDVWVNREVRLADRLAPEMKEPDGPGWRRELEVLYPPGSVVSLKTKGRREKEKYGRVLGTISHPSVAAVVAHNPAGD